MSGQTPRFGPTHRGGPIFRWLGEPLALDLANTMMVVREGEELDLIETPPELGRWLEAERPRLGDCEFATAHLAAVHRLRDATRALLASVVAGRPAPDWAVSHLNELSTAAPVAPRLRSNGGALSTDEMSAGGDRMAQLLGAIARSAMSIVTGPDAARLRICAAPSCGMFFIGARRWCCAACGNRARAARHYRRHRGSRRAARAR